MMKKRVSFFLVALLLLGTTACGKDEDTTETTTQQEQTEVTTQEVTTEEETTETVATEETTVEAATETATEETTTEETTTEATSTEAVHSNGAITVEEAEQLIVKSLGTEDEETGNTFSFMHVNTMEVSGVEYHVFAWSWYVDGNMSHLTDLFVATDGSGIYEGMFSGDGGTVYTETNYLE